MYGALIHCRLVGQFVITLYIYYLLVALHISKYYTADVLVMDLFCCRRQPGTLDSTLVSHRVSSAVSVSFESSAQQMS